MIRVNSRLPRRRPGEGRVIRSLTSHPARVDWAEEVRVPDWAMESDSVSASALVDFPA